MRKLTPYTPVSYTHLDVYKRQDLLHWEKVREPILSFGPEGTYYSGHVHKASIVKKDDTLYHFYCATCPWKEGDPTSAYGEYRTICVAANKKF